MAPDKQLIFITGGVRSGKSSLGERLACEIKEQIGGELHYIATGVVTDGEMDRRIQRHREERDTSTHVWKTWEQSKHVSELAPLFGEKDVILLDCLTYLVNNEFFVEGDCWQKQAFLGDLKERILSGLKQIFSKCHTLIVVSNEVLFEPIHDNPLVISYCRLLGELHQAIVCEADRAYEVYKGIPLVKKGNAT
jgi:adenosylcobinamide kinase/adenosylcobinamide-phosphate guanylyltransferase